MRYIDADELYRETEKKIKANHECRMAVVDDEFLDLINDAFTEDVVPRAELAVRSFQDAATIDDLQKKLAVATETLKYIFSDLKKQIHDKAVYPNCHGVEPYISLKVFDAVINKLIGS